MLKTEELKELIRIRSLASSDNDPEHYIPLGVRDGRVVALRWDRNHDLSADECSLILLRRVADQLGHAYALELTKPHPRLSSLATAIRGVIAAHKDREPTAQTGSIP